MSKKTDMQGSVTGAAQASTIGHLSWALFEFARAPYLVFVYIFVFGPYFANVVVGDPVRGQELWSVANTLVGLVVAALAPLLGAIADRSGRRKPWLLSIVLVMAPCCFALWWAMPGAVGGLSITTILALIIVLAGCFLLSEVFHNAMLPSIINASGIGRLSGYGIAANNLGALIALSLMLFFIALPSSNIIQWSILPDRPLFNLDPDLYEHDRIGGPMAGLWLLCFTLPLLLWTPDTKSNGIPYKQAVREGVEQLKSTVRQAKKMSNIALYLFARMLYNDGKVAALAYSGIYAAGVFSWELPQLLLFAVLLTPFSIAGGLLGGWLDTVFGSKIAIQVSITLSILAIFGIVSVTPDTLFFTIEYIAEAHPPVWDFAYFQTLPEWIFIGMTMLLSMTITAAFTNSRTMMTRLAPISMMSQFFGLYALSGTATAFLGHMFVGSFTLLFDSQRIGLASVTILMISGLVLMFWVKEERSTS